MKTRSLWLILFVLFGLGAAAHAQADVASREKQFLRRLQVMQQQMNEQNAALRKERDDLAAQLEAAQASVASLKEKSQKASGKAQGLEKSLQAQQSDNASLTQQLAEAQQALATLRQEHVNTLATLKASEGDNRQFKAANAWQQRQIADCEHKNLLLYQANTELLEKYKNKNVWDALAQKEPFTGIEKVRIDNVLQEYRDKLAADRVKPTGSAGQDGAAH